MGKLLVTRVFNPYNPNAGEPKVIGGEVLLRYDDVSLVVQAVEINWGNCDRAIEFELEAEDDNGSLKVVAKGEEREADKEVEVEIEGVALVEVTDPDTGEVYLELPGMKFKSEVKRSSKEVATEPVRTRVG